MGYKGLSADSSYTDEVAGDWADEAYGDNETFKSAWFWAVEDWWIDDVGGVYSSGEDGTHAAFRRDSLRRTWVRRPAGVLYYGGAWSWHNG